MLSRWSWSRSAATRKRAYERDFAPQAIVLAVLMAGVALVFWQQLVGAAVFIGECDRLNSYLNMRLAEYDALRTYGRVPAWNPTMFGGFSVAALHWMNPATDPIAFFLQLFPRGHVYLALGYISIALVLAACITAYFYIRDLTGARIPAPIAALCYGLSAFGIHRIARSRSRRRLGPRGPFQRSLLGRSPRSPFTDGPSDRRPRRSESVPSPAHRCPEPCCY
jgi:hypothetical protein